ncbi:hypothetical protein [Qipengyuania sp. MTN3-11]
MLAKADIRNDNGTALTALGLASLLVLVLVLIIERGGVPIG